MPAPRLSPFPLSVSIKVLGSVPLSSIAGCAGAGGLGGTVDMSSTARIGDVGSADPESACHLEHIDEQRNSARI